MAKIGVLMYYDLLEQLKDFTDEQFGKVVRAIIKYDKDGIEPRINDSQIKLAFNILKPTIDRNKQEYQDKCNKNRENINKRWNKQNTNEYDGIRMNTKHTDIDNDIDIEKDNAIKKEINKEKNVPPTLEEVKEYAKSRNREDLAIKFFEYFEAGNWIDSEGKKVVSWKQKFLTWEKRNPISKCDNSKGKEYTSEELNSLISNISEVDI